MNKRGFTLIELLAIIVILGLIAVITIPLVNKTIEDSKRNAAKDSSYGYKNAVHQFYLTELAVDSNFDFDGEYDISNGSISDGVNTYNISTSGSSPESGNVVISNGEIFSGCVNYGKYSVIIRDGEVTETVSGNCITAKYFSYDSTNDEQTDIQVSLNSSWNPYIKVFEHIYNPVYEIYNVDLDLYETVLGNVSLEECQSVVEDLVEEDGHNYECRTSYYKKYELCGLSNNETFCLKPGRDNYTSNVGILDGVFSGCDTVDDYYFCSDEEIGVKVFTDGNISIKYLDEFTCHASEYSGNSSAYCSGDSGAGSR